jgi:hypothetical protein
MELRDSLLTVSQRLYMVFTVTGGSTGASHVNCLCKNYYSHSPCANSKRQFVQVPNT